MPSLGPFSGNKLSVAIIIASNNPVNQQWAIPEKKTRGKGRGKGSEPFEDIFF